MTINQLIANANAITCRKNPLYLEEHEGDTYICQKDVQNQFIDLDDDIVPQFKAIYNRFRTFETLPKRLRKTAWMNQVSYEDKKMTCYSPDILKTLKKLIP